MRPLGTGAARLAATLILFLAPVVGPAHADVVRFKYIADGEDTIGSLPVDEIYRLDRFGFCGVAGGETGVCSRVEHLESIRSTLPMGPDDALEEFFDADVSMDDTTTPGQLVTARASVGGVLSPGGFPSPVRAQTELFANHLDVVTDGNLFFHDSSQEHLQDVFKAKRSYGEATSLWFDTWTAAVTETKSTEFRLDGHADVDPFFCDFGTSCGLSFPKGTNSVFRLTSFADLQASVSIFDLDTLLPCQEQFFDACDGSEREFERVIARVGAEISLQTGDPAVDVDIRDIFEFDVIAGHRYLTVATVHARSQNGGDLDFMNTFALTRLDDPMHNISSLAEQRFGAILPRGAVTTSVPAPASASLLLAAVLMLVAKGRRRA